jgi:hypothetical protein
MLEGNIDCRVTCERRMTTQLFVVEGRRSNLATQYVTQKDRRLGLTPLIDQWEPNALMTSASKTASSAMLKTEKFSVLCCDGESLLESLPCRFDP